MSRSSSIIAGLLAAAAIVGAAPAAHADNNISIQNFGDCTPREGEPGCSALTVDEAGFRAFTTDLGMMLAPFSATTAETLGEAGFAFQIDHQSHGVDSSSAHWRLADADGTVAATQSVTQFHFRKGLPMSFELGAVWTRLWQSDLSAAGAELRWALHEDYYWPAPDIAVRGFASTMVGSRQLQMFLTGADVVVSEHIGVGDVMNISPFVGYNMTYVIASTRLIDATPNDLTPAEIEQTSPEFSFSDETESAARWFGGVRFQVAFVDLIFQGAFSDTLTTYTTSIGLDF